MWPSVLLLIIVLIISAVVLYVVPRRQVRFLASDRLEQLKQESEARKNLALLLGGALTLSGVFLQWTSFQLSQREKWNERFTKGVAEIESDRLSARLHGAYELEALLKTADEGDDRTIVSVITALLRANVRAPEKPTASATSDIRPSPDLQLLLTILGRRPNVSTDRSSAIDLSATDLQGANLRSAHLEWSYLVHTNLQGAYLYGAHLDNAELLGAQMGAIKIRLPADSSGAGPKTEPQSTTLSCANLSHTVLSGSNLSGASLAHANLEGAFMNGVILENAFLAGASLKGADFSGVDLRQVQGLSRNQVDQMKAYDRQNLPQKLADSDDRSNEEVCK